MRRKSNQEKICLLRPSKGFGECMHDNQQKSDFPINVVEDGSTAFQQTNKNLF